MQSDILGASALGINTMLCLSGDHPSFGDHPQAANVHDIDSMLSYCRWWPTCATKESSWGATT